MIEDLKQQLAQIMLLVSCKNITELQQAPYVLSAELLAFRSQL